MRTLCLMTDNTLNDRMTFDTFGKGQFGIVKEWARQRRRDAEVVDVVDASTGEIVYTVQS